MDGEEGAGVEPAPGPSPLWSVHGEEGRRVEWPRRNGSSAFLRKPTPPRPSEAGLVSVVRGWSPEPVPLSRLPLRPAQISPQTPYAYLEIPVQ